MRQRKSIKTDSLFLGRKKKVSQTKYDCVKVACVVHEFTQMESISNGEIRIPIAEIASTNTIRNRFDSKCVYCEHTLNTLARPIINSFLFDEFTHTNEHTYPRGHT